MSQIEQALKRAREAQPPGSVETEAEEHAAPGSVPSPDVFAAPWAFEEKPDAGTSVWDSLILPPPAAAADTIDDTSTPSSESLDSVVEPIAPMDDPIHLDDDGESEALESAVGEPSALSADLALFQGFNPAMSEKIVTMPSIRPAFVEQYRKLASALHHAQLERTIKVVMVTSSLASEGKTLTATNLALTFSESYRRSVLLIDADLRRPSLHEAFQIPNIAGLGDALRAESDQKLSLVRISEHLTLLPAGRPESDPMSGLTSERMKRIVEEATELFDWVILDTPPVGLLPDAKLLAGMVDCALVVIQAGKTPIKLIRKTVETVGRDKILGVVLNRADEPLISGYGYYSYYDSYAKKDRK
jgi:protein-tyrosine kinase